MSARIDELHKVVDRLADCIDSCATAIGQHLEKIEKLEKHQKGLEKHQKGLAKANNCNGDAFFMVQKQLKLIAHAHDVTIEILARDTEFDVKSYATCLKIHERTEAKAHLESCLDPDWDKPTGDEQ